MLAAHASELAAVIIEPLIQCAGGFRAIPGISKVLRRLCDQYGVLLIFDEVATGWSHRNHVCAGFKQVCPDLLVLGKGLTCGYSAHAATLASREIMQDSTLQRLHRFYAWPDFHGQCTGLPYCIGGSGFIC